MAALDFRITVLTPAFLAGAMEEDVAGGWPRLRVIGPGGDGLRVPSLRGVLRFWFRAMEGASGPGGLAALARREALVFGGTATGQGLRIVPAGQDDWTGIPIHAPRQSARAYLGYGPLNDVQGQFSSHNKRSRRDAIPEGTGFRFVARGSAAALADLRRALLLLHLFGGIGARSRRGWGSVEVAAEGVPVFGERQALADYYQRAMALVWPDSAFLPSARPSSPAFSAFSAGTQIRGFKAPQPGGPKEAMAGFHACFLESRIFDRSKPGASPPTARADHQVEKADAYRIPPSITRAPDRLAFGLPYNVTLGRGTPSETSLQYEAGYPQQGTRMAVKRRASPLLLKVLRNEAGAHFGIGLFLDGRFFSHPDTTIGAKLRTAGGKFRPIPGFVPPPGYSAIAQFLAASLWTPIPLP